MSTAIAIITALLNGVPKLVELIKQGRNPADIKLSDFISTDALTVLEKARQDAQSYVDNG